MKYLGETTERICAIFTGKMCLVPCSGKFEGQSKGQGFQGQKTAFFNPFSGMRAVYVDKTSSASSCCMQ